MSSGETPLSDTRLTKILQGENPVKAKRWGTHLRNVFTTGQVARICQVAPRTVSKWFDTGRLGGYRIPGSDDRRIPRTALLKFLSENHIDVNWLLYMPWDTVLLVGVSPILHQALIGSLTEREGFRVKTSPDLVGAAILSGECKPDLAVIDLCLPDAHQLSRSLSNVGVICLALTNEDDPDPDSHLERGFTLHLPKPVDPDALVIEVRKLLVTRHPTYSGAQP